MVALKERIFELSPFGSNSDDDFGRACIYVFAIVYVITNLIVVKIS